MAVKNPSNRSEFRLQRQVASQARKLNQDLEVEAFLATAESSVGLSEFHDHRLDPPTLRSMLELNDCRVALISRTEWDHLQRSKVERFPHAAPAFLLPFSWKELLARVHEFVGDSNGLAARRVVRFADVCVDFIKMEVKRISGEVITLTRQEFKTLKCFLSNPERVFSRGELLHEAWGYQNYPSTRTVDNHVLKLRKKLERDPTRPVHFRTVHSSGYKFVP